ncbi:hypothetical protein J3L18_13185 [Mucilaginibacter gossypii]|uniref:hypothetical protein n=1 Tax=Mucilaginibacter gossypii TaxID=551996 RepID=UPI000DCD4DF5|nr:MULTISPECIES: hypothetical protein [Mucilaginibacter]QTE39958.1 hypothetical protein J3L18_13185 [Mucilaginibacter gossypii]RAV54298.1 hypothetical protein DIU36_20815 [Mucilaginibacter rubeus]
MAIEIKYKNSLGVEVSAQQANLLQGDYSSEHYVDDVLQKIDIYENGELSTGEYYLSEGENLQSVLAEYQSLWSSGTFFTNKQQVGNYTVMNWGLYEKTEKLEEGRKVWDNQGRIIAEEHVDAATHQVLYTVKYFYLTNFGSFAYTDRVLNYGTLEFTYGLSEPDEITVSVNLPDFDNEIYYITEEENILNHPLIAPLFSWDTQTYYHSDQLLPI